MEGEGLEALEQGGEKHPRAPGKLPLGPSRALNELASGTREQSVGKERRGGRLSSQAQMATGWGLRCSRASDRLWPRSVHCLIEPHYL